RACKRSAVNGFACTMFSPVVSVESSLVVRHERTGSSRLRLQPIFMMQAPKNGVCHHTTMRGQPMSGATEQHGEQHGRLGDTWPQGHVGTALIVMRDPLAQHPSQVVFRQGNHEVQGFPPEGSKDPFTDGIGLWTVRWCLQHAQPQVAYAPVQGLGEDAIAVMDKEAVAMVH